MPWQDRIRQAKYTPPSQAEEFEFDYVDVSRVTEKRTTAFSFIGVNESYVQDNGYGSRKYAMRCLFNGDSHDVIATRFEAALLENGVGQLEHPLYGSLNVVPFGTITRNNNMVRSANQSVVVVTFWTTTGVVYPTSERSPANEVLAAIVVYDAQAAETHQDTVDVDWTVKAANFRGGIEEQLAVVNATLRKPSEATEEVSREFREWQQIINKSINVLAGNPFLLAQQIGNLIKAPASALLGIESRLVSYANAIRSAQASTSGTPWDQPPAQSQPRRQTQMANDWRSADLTATYSLVSMALAAVETEYKTKPEAFSVADFLLSELDIMAAWRDRGFAVFAGVEYGAQIQVIDDGKAWAAATNTIYLCAGYLVGLAFSLASERTMVLDRPRTVIDLAAELYGSVDDRLDFLISSNALTGSEILELPRGHEIVWYPT